MNSEKCDCFIPFPLQQILKMLLTQNKSFNLIHNGKNYPINPILLSIASHKIYRLSLADPLINSYEIPNIEGDFQPIYDLLSQIPSPPGLQDNAMFALEIGIDLELLDYLPHIINFIPITYFLNNENQILNRLYNIGYNLEVIIENMSMNINQCLASDTLLYLPIPLLDLFLKQTETKIPSKDLQAFLSKIFSIQDSPNHRLAKYYPLTELNEHDLKHYLSNPKLNLNLQRYSIVQSLYKKSGFKKSRPPILAPFPTSNLMPNPISRGLIRQLILKSPENITFDSSSVAKPTNMQDSYALEVLYTKEGYYFCTEYMITEPVPRIRVTLSNVLLFPTGYGMKSWKGASNKVAPYSWELQASNDLINWEVLDTVNQCETLFADNAELFRPILTQNLYKHFQLIQKQTGHPFKTVLALGGFEIYGKVIFE